MKPQISHFEVRPVANGYTIDLQGIRGKSNEYREYRIERRVALDEDAVAEQIKQMTDALAGGSYDYEPEVAE